VLCALLGYRVIVYLGSLRGRAALKTE